MKAILTVLLVGLLTACATPNELAETREVPAERPGAATERIDPVVAAPVAVVPPEPATKPESKTETETERVPDARIVAAEESLAESAAASSGTAAPGTIEESDSSSRASPTSETLADTVNLSGRVAMTRDGRQLPFASLHLNQTVIAWRPAGQGNPAPMEEQQIVTRRSRFFPQTMVVTSGTEIRFPNMDSIRHNVFSLTPGHQFDVGLYDQGPGRSQRFTATGMVELYCNIHPNMAAFVLVLDTPHFVSPDENGAFTLRGLPTGPGELLVWNYRAENIFQRFPMRLTAVSEPLELQVDITRPAVPQHTNKHGEAYGRDRSRP